MATETQARTPAAIDPYAIAFQQTIPPQGGTAFKMYAGQVLRIIDVEGKQVADLISFNVDDYEDKTSVHNTLLLNKTIFIKKGHVVWSTKGTKLMTIVADTVGVHDLISGSCSKQLNSIRYGVRGTPTCRGNFVKALEPYGIPLGEIPYSFNIFMNTVIRPDGSANIQEPRSKAGDYIDLRAEVDQIVAISNCPQERNPCNGFKPTPLHTIVFEPGVHKP